MRFKDTVSSTGQPCVRELTESEITSMFNQREKIQLIKKYREISGRGLMDSKNIICEYMDKNDLTGLINQFRILAITEELPKEAFINMISEAIDSMEKFQYTDMLEAVMTLLENIKKRGGLTKIAQERHEFISNI